MDIKSHTNTLKELSHTDMEHISGGASWLDKIKHLLGNRDARQTSSGPRKLG